MKKSNLLAALLLFVVAMSSYAQKIDVQWGEEVSFKHGYTLITPIGAQEGKLFVKTSKCSMFGACDFGIGVIDTKALNVVDNKEIKVEDKRANVVATICAKGKRWLFTQSEVAKITYIKAYNFDAKGAVLPKATIVAEFKDQKVLSSTNGIGAGVSVILSPDTTKMALIINANRKKDENEVYYLKVFDTDLKETWSQLVELPYTEKQFVEQDVNVDNQGTVQIFGKLYNKMSKKEANSRTEAAYKYLVRTYNGKEKEGKEYIIDLDGKFVGSASLTNRPDNGNLVAVGLYADKNGTFFEGMAFTGFFYLEVAPDGTVAKKYLQEMDAQNIRNISREVLAKKGNGLTEANKIIETFFKKDGSILLVTEHSYVVTHTNPKTGATSYTYHNNDNIVFCIDPQGKRKWSTCVPKSQSSGREHLTGSSVFFKNDNIYLLYNDSERNLEREPNGKPAGLGMFDKAVITLSKVSADGKLTRKAVTTKKDLGGYWFAPKMSTRIADNDFIFVGAKLNLLGEKNKLGRITVGE